MLNGFLGTNPNAFIDELGHGGSRGAGAPGTLGNFTATHSLGQTISEGLLSATALINPSAGSQNKGGSLFLSDGGANFLEVQALGGGGGGSPYSEFNAISAGGTNPFLSPFFNLLLFRFSDELPIDNFNDVAWVQVEIEYNLSTGNAVGRLRDVIEAGGNHPNIVLGTNWFERSFPYFTPFDVTTVGFRSNNAYATNPGRIDNIDVSFVPEPATAAMLVLGMVALMLVCRRKNGL